MRHKLSMYKMAKKCRLLKNIMFQLITAGFTEDEVKELCAEQECLLIKLAYFSYKDYYIKFEELPSGDEYADIVYLPRKSSPMSALVIELFCWWASRMIRMQKILSGSILV